MSRLSKTRNNPLKNKNKKSKVAFQGKGSLIQNQHKKNRQVYRSMNFTNLNNMYSLRTSENENSNIFNENDYENEKKVLLSQNQTVKMFKIKKRKHMGSKGNLRERKNLKNYCKMRRSVHGSMGWISKP